MILTHKNEKFHIDGNEIRWTLKNIKLKSSIDRDDILQIPERIKTKSYKFPQA